MDARGAGVAGIVEFMTPSFLQQWHPTFRSEDLHKMPSIPCVPLHLLVNLFGISHINFFSLDVEGAELEVLKSVDLLAVSFDVIVVEASNHNKSKNMAVVELLDHEGYLFHKHVV